MNNIEIIKTEIDWLKLIEMAFKREDWGKTYTLYKLNDVYINCNLVSFNFERNYADYKIGLYYISPNLVHYNINNNILLF